MVGGWSATLPQSAREDKGRVARQPGGIFKGVHRGSLVSANSELRSTPLGMTPVCGVHAVSVLRSCLTNPGRREQSLLSSPGVLFSQRFSCDCSICISGTLGQPSRVSRCILSAQTCVRRTTMNETGCSPWKRLQEHWLTRRNLIRGAAGTALGVGLLRPELAWADDEDGDSERAACVGPNPIPGGVTGLKPFGIFIHHNPLNPATPLANINDPSQIADFDGFVGLTHIRGGGMGTDTATGAMTRLAFQADMGFSQGKFIGTDGQQHRGTFAFV